MKRFHFALQPVLEQRERIEDEKQQIVAAKLAAAQAAEHELRRLNDEFRRYSDRVRGDHRQFEGEELRRFSAHLQFLDRTIVAQIHLVAQRRTEVDRARSDLFEATKERKVVEKLKDKRREAYVLEEQRVEQRELDDNNARRFGRAASGGHHP